MLYLLVLALSTLALGTHFFLYIYFLLFVRPFIIVYRPVSATVCI